MTEESIYDSRAMKELMGIDFHDADAPDATTLLSFRRLPERNGPQKKLFEAINAALEREGMIWRGGSVVDAGTGMVHSLTFTSANVADVTEASKLVREDDRFAVMDAGYAGVEKREEVSGDERLSAVDWRVSPRMGTRRALESELCKDALGRLDWAAQPQRDAWMEKNGARLYMLFGLANVYRWLWRKESLGARPVSA